MATNLGKPLRLRNDGGAQLQLDRAGAVFSLEAVAGGLALMSGNVGIGTTSPGEVLEVRANAAMVKVDSTGSFAQLGYYSSGTLLWNAYADIATSEYRLGNLGGTRLALTSDGNLLPGSNNAYDLGATGTRFRDGWFARDVAVGRGVAFPATQSPSTDPNTLDDYEEGTWTPTLTGSGGSAGSYAQSFDLGTYTKIGRLVTATAVVSISDLGSWSGDVRCSLPFAPAANVEKSSAVRVQFHTFTGYPVAEPEDTSQFVRFNLSASGAAQANWQWSELVDTVGNTINFTISYAV